MLLQSKMVNAADFPTLQMAVDALEEFGTLYVPAGEWACSGIKLKSNMTLHLALGAKLVAPARIEEYVPCPDWKRESSLTCAFLALYEVENVVIEGEGMLELGGERFWIDFDNDPADLIPPRTPERRGSWSKRCYSPMAERPIGVLLWKCKNIILRDITIAHAAAYTVWAIGCDKLRYTNVTLNNHRRGPNTDGFDVDSCCDVQITGCNLNTGDDAIALKTDTEILGFDKACERVIISNNIITSECCGVRLGYEGDGAIRDVIISNNVIHHTDTGVDMLSIVPYQFRFNIRKGTPIERVLVDNITMNDVRIGFKLWSGGDGEAESAAYSAYIKNVSLRNMYITACSASFIGGKCVKGIELENITMQVNGILPDGPLPEAVDMPDVWGHAFLRNPLTLYQVDDLQMNNVKITGKYPR